MSYYPHQQPGYGYGAPPPAQPYGMAPPQPYGSDQPYGAPQPYGSAQPYGAPPTSYGLGSHDHVKPPKENKPYDPNKPPKEGKLMVGTGGYPMAGAGDEPITCC